MQRWMEEILQPFSKVMVQTPLPQILILEWRRSEKRIMLVPVAGFPWFEAIAPPCISDINIQVWGAKQCVVIRCCA